MKITIESTTKVVTAQDGDQGIPIRSRLWEWKTEGGIRVICLIPRIAALATEDLSEFEAELEEQKHPSEAVQAFPTRMIL